MEKEIDYIIVTCIANTITLTDTLCAWHKPFKVDALIGKNILMFLAIKLCGFKKSIKPQALH